MDDKELKEYLKQHLKVEAKYVYRYGSIKRLCVRLKIDDEVISEDRVPV